MRLGKGSVPAFFLLVLVIAIFPSVVVAQSSSASFIRTDTTTQGNWHGGYGADGFSVAGDSQSIPSYGTFALNNQQDYTWASSTADVRALQTSSGIGRIAATWYNSSAFSMDVNLTDGNTHQLALYVLDWDSAGRSETISISDATSQTVLDTRAVSAFSNGVYLVWNISGHVLINVSGTAGPSAVVSGVFFGGSSSVGSTATFVRTDTTTQGNWHGAYGADGYSVANDTQSIPAYASFLPQNQSNVTWAASSSDPRALQTGNGAGRIASTWYGASDFDFDVNFTDGQTHQVALYALDWDSLGRAEVVQVLDAATLAVLDTRTISGFGNGQYLVWNLSGHVRIDLISSAGPNAVISGVFFGGSSTVSSAATFVKSDLTTEGNWHAAYGADGYSVANDSQSIPAYASFAVQNQLNWTWDASSGDIRAPQTGDGSGRIAATWYSDTSFNFDVNFTDGQPHQFALYAMDWDSLGRTEVIQILDAATEAVLDTRALSNFSNGVYLVWNISGHVHINVISTAGPNAVVSSVFFGGSTAITSTATFVGNDATTEGNWQTTYGKDGYSVANAAQSLPSYASFAVQNQSNWTWDPSPSDPRALLAGTGSARIAATWYNNPEFSLDVNLTDGKAHQLALYALDWDSAGRTEVFQVLDAATEALLDTRTISSFSNGEYLIWNISGHVRINVIGTAGPNAVVSGVFFGSASGTGGSPVLQSITITPGSLSTSAGARQQFAAIGTYSDGSTQNISGTATWSSSTSSVAAINNTGLAIALGAGQTTIQASVGSISGSASLTVNALAASTPPLYPRFSHTATRLNDGTVLLVGGTGDGSNIAGPSTVAVAEVYNAQTGTFSASGALATPRFSHTASLLNDGTVLVAGGYDDDGDTQASAEIYNPASGTFSTTGNMSTPRVYHTATVMSGLVLLAGGLDENYNDTGSAEVFNPATGTFTASGSMITARDSHTATLLNDGTVLFTGGSDENGDTLASTEIYNPGTGSFTVGANMNVPRRLHTATLLNSGKVLIVGGFDENGNAINSAELYDPQAQTFTLVPNTLANARADHTATLLEDGTVLVAGGTDQFGTIFGFGGFEQYDPSAGTFSVAGNMFRGRKSHAATRLDDGSVLFTGGVNSDFTTEGSSERFQPVNLTPPNLVSIMLSPAAPAIPGGTSRSLAAIGTFSDSSVQTLASAIWTSSDNTLATVTSDATNQGEVYGIGQGTPQIIACAGAVCSSTTPSITASQLQITALQPNSGDVGTPVTISGTQFGQAAGTVTFNGVPASVVNWLQTSILVNVPTNATTGNVVVSVNGANSNPLAFAVVPRPQITSLSQNIGVAGTPITLKGSDFGATQGSSLVTFNGTVGTVQSWSDSVIVVSVANGASTGNIVVTVSGLASNGQLFTIPVISNINPFDGPPGILLTIAGSGFGEPQGSGTAMVGNTPIRVFTWTDSQIVGAVAPGTQSGTVTVQQGSLTITGPAFTVDTPFPYTITPQSLSMVVGDSRTVSAVDSQGNPIKGLDWTTTDKTIVSLSTDDPPVITALAPGSVTVYAGDVPLPINVYASTSAMPPGTPIWSVPVGGSGPIQFVPAIPTAGPPGTDVFALDSTGTLTALASHGSTVWKQSGIGATETTCLGSQNCTTFLATSVIPDFSGSAVLKKPYLFLNSQNISESTHKVQYVNRTTGALQDLYTFSDVYQYAQGFGNSRGASTDAESQSGRFAVQSVIPHPSGTVFVQDTSTVSVIDPTGAQPTTSLTLNTSTMNGGSFYTGKFNQPAPEPDQIGKMIVAGDGNAYVPYTYSNLTFQSNPDGSSTSSAIQHLMVLRISSDGSSASTEIGTWSSTTNCVPITDSQNQPATQCSTSPPFGGVSDLHVITNADQGIAVFAIAASYGCSVMYTGNPNFLPPNVCSGDTGHNHQDIYYFAQDALTSHVTDAGIFPNDLSGPLQFAPELQREDGSYIGSDSGYNYVMAMGASGGILWQHQTGSALTQSVPARPLYATADGGVIFTTSVKDCAPGDISLIASTTLECQTQDGFLPIDASFGHLGTIYTLDQNGNQGVDANGNPIPPAPDTGTKPSWGTQWYGSSAAQILETSAPFASFHLAPTYAGIFNGNQSNQNVAIQQVETNKTQGPAEQLPDLFGATCVSSMPNPLPTCGNINAIDLITNASPDFIFQTYIQTYFPVTLGRNSIMDFQDPSGSSNFTVSGPGQVLTISMVPLVVKLPAMVAGESKFSIMTERFDSANHVISAVTLEGHPLAGWRYWRVYSVGPNEVIIETGAYDQPGPGPLNYFGYYLSKETVSFGWQQYLESIQRDLPKRGFTVQLGSKTKTSLGGIPLFFTPARFNPNALLDGYWDTGGDFTNYILFNVCQSTTCH